MKVCKKCKKHVSNKMKICKYCGADVSKARIIKNNSKVNGSKTNKVLNNHVDVRKNVNVKNDSKLKNVNKVASKNVKKVSLKNTENNIEKENLKIKINNFHFICRIKSVLKKIKKFLVRSVESFNNKKVFKNRLSYKTLALIVICLVVLGISSYFGVDAYRDFTNADNTVVVGEKATTEKIFGMGDLITYNGMDYKVVKVETSEGNSYKAPKEGNQFLIVTVYMKNNTGEKVQYSYKNWTMSNSNGDEEKRIFTSVNVDTALYSGDLVIGGIKTGSMVFEQPIGDPKLRMNFYELKKDKNGEEVIDTNKKIFSVSIKVPEETEDAEQGENPSNDSDVKAIKTSDQKKS
ncbi:MAG: DUF4352 domain-containing protein [Bacilli bacterium]